MQNFITQPSAALLRRFCVWLLVIGVAACSMARFGYDNGETITYWWMNGYAGFHSSQGSWVLQRIDALFAWHRRTQLKDYVQLLTAAQLSLQHEIGLSEVLTQYDALTMRADRVVSQAAPDLADFVLTMDDDNLIRLKEKFAANNEAFRKDYLRGDLQEQQDFRYRKVMNMAEYWFGDFSDEQKAMIRRASDRRPMNNEMWLDDRRQRQQVLLALVRRIRTEKPSRDVVAALLTDYATHNYVVCSTAGPEMRAFFEASKQGLAQLTVLIINMTTPKQKAHAIAKLQSWIDDFNSLATTG
jgi:hypothetical protein